jgi:UDP-N-acetylmuramyl pentapeptide phosphotransferase/UDP-N-acetylglucosamine-1-phosphate transferase
MNFIIGGLLAFLLTFYAIPILIQLAHRKKLYDLPDERKVHTKVIPRLGGIAMFIGVLLSLLLTIVLNSQNGFQYYTIALLVIFFLGCQDDLLSISPMKKFTGQLIVAAVLTFKGKLLITSMHGFMGLQALDPFSSYFLSFFTIILIINAFNLIDGIDGLAGTISLVTSAVLGIYFLLNGDTAHAQLAFTLAGSIAGFLIFNFHPARIFMGDTGSMLLGLVNAILVIHFIEKAPVYTQYPFQASPAIGFGILLIPLMDTLRVFGIRILHRRSPFTPDRNHLHHILLAKGFSHKTITQSIGLATLACCAAAFASASLGVTTAILLLIGLFFTGIGALRLVQPRQQPLHLVQATAGAENEQEEEPAVKLVPLFHYAEQQVAVEKE